MLQCLLQGTVLADNRCNARKNRCRSTKGQQGFTQVNGEVIVKDSACPYVKQGRGKKHNRNRRPAENNNIFCSAMQIFENRFHNNSPCSIIQNTSEEFKPKILPIEEKRMAIGISTSCLYPQATEEALETLGKMGVRTCEVFLNTISETTPEFIKILNKFGIVF